MRDDFWLVEVLHQRAASREAGRELWEEDQAAAPVRRVEVLGEHPVNSYDEGDIVAIPAEKPDPFWVAKVTKVEENKLTLLYYTCNKPTGNNKRTWRVHDSTRETKGTDVLVRFKHHSDIFTKRNEIKKVAYTKIAQACVTFLNIDMKGKYQ